MGGELPAGCTSLPDSCGNLFAHPEAGIYFWRGAELLYGPRFLARTVPQGNPRGKWYLAAQLE